MRIKLFVVFMIFPVILCCFLNSVSAAPNTGGDKFITDIAHWNHPVKTVFQKYNVVIFKLILQKNNTYPIFFVRFPLPLSRHSIQSYRNIIEEVARANAYWDYSLVDETQKLILEVVCNRKRKILQNVVINHDAQYFDRLLQGDTVSSDETDLIFNYLIKKVPEIESYRRIIAAAAKDKKAGSPDQVTFIIRVDGEPDPQSSDVYLRNYYSVYVGENHDDHTVRWKTFLVKKDLSAILVDDPISGEYLTLQDWRNKESREQ